jgi:hypothetical protein
MDHDLSEIGQSVENRRLGDRIRSIASQLRQETDVQIKATSRILGAAAQMAQNQDRLIDEVVDMVQEDLNRQAASFQPEAYTVSQLKQQFKAFKDAKAHFGIKASSWDVLVVKLNEQPRGQSQRQSLHTNSPTSQAPETQPLESQPSESLIQRLETIEREVKTMRKDLDQVLDLLTQIAEKLL